MAVIAGQIYRDNDSRAAHTRHLVVLKVVGQRARCASGHCDLPALHSLAAITRLMGDPEFNPSQLLKHPLLYGKWRQVFISAKRLQNSGGRGYVLVHNPS